MSENGKQETVAVARKEVAVPDQGGSIGVFTSQSNFEQAQRMAQALSRSGMIPMEYRGNLPNVLVAMELAARTGSSVLAVMQGVDIIHGRPAWRAQFKIASANRSGRYSTIRYEIEGDDPKADDYRVRAYAVELETKERLDGPWITWELVKGEGWHSKKDSKWKSIPQKMFMYRAGSWWVDLYAPDISMGMMTTDEAAEGSFVGADTNQDAVADLNAAIEAVQEAEYEIEEEGVPEGVDPDTGEIEEDVPEQPELV